MKRLGMLLVLVSVGMFALGCGKKEEPKAPVEEPAAGAPTEEGAAPAEPATPEEEAK